MLGFQNQQQKSTALFEKYASVDASGVKSLSLQDFTHLTQTHGHYFTDAQIKLLFASADVEQKQRLTLYQFLDFEKLFSEPWSEYKIVQRLIGPRSVEAVKKWLDAKSADKIDFNQEILKLHLGKDEKRELSLEELAEFIGSVKQLKIRQVFALYDTKKTGILGQQDAQTALSKLTDHETSPSLKLLIKQHFNDMAFSQFSALTHLLGKTDQVAKVLTSCMNQSILELTPLEFSKQAVKTGNLDVFSPLEIQTLFQLVNAGEHKASISQFSPLINHFYQPDESKELKQLSPLMQTLKSMYNFTLGSIAGAVGATVVYPIDLVKTRMQNQRSTKLVGQPLVYKNSWDCFKKVIRNEGVTGLYSGLIPQLVGVAPEKAIKLTMNDLVRSNLKDRKTGEIPLWGEILAGCTAGGSQVLFTNPLEIVKIRLQVQGEALKAGVENIQKMSAVAIVRQLGLVGLYKGVSACLLRDIPFSGIYFPVYAHLKKDVFHENVNGKKLTIPELLTAGAIAGIPAAYLVTPADVIKTRLQVQARKGETQYNGISDAFVKILREEGPRAFFKGGVARIMRSSPQFGVTLAVYELLQKSLPIDFGDKQPENSLTPPGWTEHDVNKQNAIRLLGDLSLKP
ncbi:mitochondrial carrier domain-containing protein [Gorgonomyces haynaldii]|nr:mitochondrial carrier domain-containing protein [Gorgonomyces haynaldii]